MKKRAGWLLPAAFLSLFSLSDMSCSSVPKIQQVWWKHFENEVINKKYDYNNLMVKEEDRDKVSKSIYLVKEKQAFADQYRDIGTGTVIKFTVNGKEENCLLTVAHLFVNVAPKAPLLEKEGYIEIKGEKIRLEKLVLDKRYDIALLKIPTNYQVQPFPFKVGSPKELKEGNYVDIIGAFADEPMHRHGTVGSLTEGLPFFLWLKQIGLGGERNDYKTLDAAINPGHSGGPVIAYRDGIPELVAIVEMSMESNYSNITGVIDIDFVIRGIETQSHGKIKLVTPSNY